MEDITDWTFDETVDLFANLDNIAESNYLSRLSPMLPEEVFWEKLQASLANARPLDQIIDKLQTHLEGDFYHIYTRGSRCMELDADMKQAVESKLVFIRVSTPRQLRSNSKRRLQPDRASVTPASSFPATPVGPRARRQTGLNGDSMDKPTASQNTPRGRSRLTSELPDTSIADTEDGPEIRQSLETCSEGRSDGSRNLITGRSPQASSEPSFYTNKLKEFPSIDYDTPDPIHQTCEQPWQCCNHEPLQDLLSDNIYFRKKLAESTTERESLLQQVRALQSHQSDGTLKILSDRIVDLESRMHDRREYLDPFLKLKTEYHLPPPILEQIESDFNKMRRGFEVLSIRKEFRYPHRDPLQQGSHKGLGHLLSRVLGDAQESALLSQLRSQVSLGELVQAIVGAAVCEWVFESDLRCTAMMQNPFVEAIRYLSSIVCGELAIRNLYLAAHQLVVHDEHFKAVFLPRTATKLADRLVEALGSFIKPKVKGRSRIPIIKRHFESIFRHALDVKTQMMIGNMFETIWPSCNSAYDELSMTARPAERGPSHGGFTDCAPVKVRLPLVPGLRFNSNDRNFVDNCTYAKGDESSLGKAKAVCKAVVAIDT